MDVNKSVLVKVFSEQVVELYRDMRIVYPNDTSIKTGLTLVEQIKTFNPKLLISKYKEGVNDEYYEQIEDLNNSNLYIVSMCNSKITHKLIKVD